MGAIRLCSFGSRPLQAFDFSCSRSGQDGPVDYQHTRRAATAAFPRSEWPTGRRGFVDCEAAFQLPAKLHANTIYRPRFPSLSRKRERPSREDADPPPRAEHSGKALIPCSISPNSSKANTTTQACAVHLPNHTTRKFRIGCRMCGVIRRTVSTHFLLASHCAKTLVPRLRFHPSSRAIRARPKLVSGCLQKQTRAHGSGRHR